MKKLGEYSEHAGTLPPQPPSLRHHPNMAFYNPPYMGTPLPPPPPPMGSRPIVTHPSSTLRSRSITPTSTHRIRIHPQHSTETYARHSTSTHGSIKSPDQTPQAHKRDRVSRVSSKHSNATYYTASNIVSPDQEVSAVVALRTPPHQVHHKSILQQHHRSLPLVVQDPSNNAAAGLAFLDPRRRQETQTREEFIT